MAWVAQTGLGRPGPQGPSGRVWLVPLSGAVRRAAVSRAALLRTQNLDEPSLLPAPRSTCACSYLVLLSAVFYLEGGGAPAPLQIRFVFLQGSASPTGPLGREFWETRLTGATGQEGQSRPVRPGPEAFV